MWLQSQQSGAIRIYHTGARHLCGFSMHPLLEMPGAGSLVPSQCMSKASPSSTHTQAAYLHCPSAAVCFGFMLQVNLRRHGGI